MVDTLTWLFIRAGRIVGIDGMGDRLIGTKSNRSVEFATKIQTIAVEIQSKGEFVEVPIEVNLNRKRAWIGWYRLDLQESFKAPKAEVYFEAALITGYRLKHAKELLAGLLPERYSLIHVRDCYPLQILA